MAESILNSDKAPEPVGLYPHARKVGNLLFLSGVGPRKKGSKDIPGVTLDDNKKIIAYSIEEQCHSVFQNVRYILEASGSRWENLVDVTVFLTNMKDDFATYNKIYAEYFKDNLPCRTTVEINCLPTPIAIELKCIATIDWKFQILYFKFEICNLKLHWETFPTSTGARSVRIDKLKALAIQSVRKIKGGSQEVQQAFFIH